MRIPTSDSHRGHRDHDHPPTLGTTFKEGRKAARSVVKQTKATSVSVTLVSKGKRVWSRTFGRVNKPGKKPPWT